METYKVIYQHGHFIDTVSHKRVIPIQGEEYIITGDRSAFTTVDTKFNIPDLLSSSDKAKWALNKFGAGKFYKIANVGVQLFFRVGNSQLIKGDESRQYIFLCTLLEDLYLYLQKGRKGDSEEDWRLANCQCILDKCLLGGLTLTEKIPAESLNKLFSHTVMFYFSMQRSGAANAFNTFFKYEPDMNIYFDSVNDLNIENLSIARKNMVKERRKQNSAT